MIERMLAIYRLYLPTARPFFPHAAAVFFFGLLGWANGYFQATGAVDNPNLKETWSVPNWSPYHAGPERALFAGLDIWDGRKPTTTAAKPEVKAQQTWAFLGTVRTGKTYAAVILLGDSGRVQRSVPGDVLPNGGIIVAVGNGSLQIDVAGDQQEIKLFQSGK